VRVPSVAEEQLRDLVRAREDVRVDLMRCRHRLSKFCLRRELHYPGPRKAWTLAHRDWLCRLAFGDTASAVTFEDYLHAHDVLLGRRDRLEQALSELAADSPWAKTIARLRCLRGIDTLSAVGLCAEVGDFARFSHPKLVASYLGLVASEDTLGPAPAARLDHQSRLKARPAAARRGGLALPPPAARLPRPAPPPARPGPTRHRHRLEDTATPPPALATPRGRARQTLDHRRRRRRTRAGPVLLGARHTRLNQPDNPATAAGAPRGQGLRAPAAGDRAMGNRNRGRARR
jgi:hypothetical protein